jgi:hypothetical protein
MKGIATTAVVLMCGLSGCGGGSEPAASPDTHAGYADCAETMGPLLDALESIDSRLDVGMAQADYGKAVGDAAVAYGKVDAGELANDCVEHVAIPLEDAYNHYVRANRRWNGCIVGDYCDVQRDALPEMRRHWSAASRLIQDAKDGLDEMG